MRTFLSHCVFVTKTLVHFMRPPSTYSIWHFHLNAFKISKISQNKFIYSENNVKWMNFISVFVMAFMKNRGILFWCRHFSTDNLRIRFIDVLITQFHGCAKKQRKNREIFEATNVTFEWSAFHSMTFRESNQRHGFYWAWKGANDMQD